MGRSTLMSYSRYWLLLSDKNWFFPTTAPRRSLQSYSLSICDNFKTPTWTGCVCVTWCWKSLRIREKITKQNHRSIIRIRRGIIPTLMPGQPSEKIYWLHAGKEWHLRLERGYCIRIPKSYFKAYIPYYQEPRPQSTTALYFGTLQQIYIMPTFPMTSGTYRTKEVYWTLVIASSINSDQLRSALTFYVSRARPLSVNEQPRRP